MAGNKQDTSRKPGETDKAYAKRMARNARQRAWAAANQDYVKGYEAGYLRDGSPSRAKREYRYRPLTPEQRKRKAKTMAIWRKKNLQHCVDYNRLWRHAHGMGPQPTATGPSGSVLIAAAPSAFRDVLDEITRKVPRWSDRDELVAEAALLYVQGLDVDAAVRQATKNVSKSASEFRYMMSLDAKVYSDGAVTYGNRVHSDAVHF